MYEFEYFNGDHFITFDIVETDIDKNKITLAISNQGRITQDTFDLFEDENGCMYFEYGIFDEKIYLDDFRFLRR